MSYNFGLKFGSGDPRPFTGLSPTFLLFYTDMGVTMTPPGITEIMPGSGQYQFNYQPSPTFTIFFLADGGAAVTDSSVRYLSGTLDPVAATDRSIGFSTDSIGGTLSPSTIFGFAMRNDAIWQADASFNKTSGVWSQYAKGTSTLLFSKIFANTSAQVTKT